MTSPRDMLDQQVDDLRGRMRLLQQDRRANVDLLESNKSSNSDEIRFLREENKKFRLKLTQLQKQLSIDHGDKHELATFQREALHLRTEFDSLKVVSNKHVVELRKLKDEARVCELEAKKPHLDDGPLSKRICMLEKKLDKAMIKSNEAQSIHGTYEHIVKRLKEERLSFNNQLTALERTLKAKRRDYDELLLLSGDANHAREIAQHQLQQSRSTYEEKRARRAVEVKERQQVVRIRRQMLDKQERREAKKKDVLEQAEKLKRENLYASGYPFSIIQDEDFIEEQENRLRLYEETFRKIKEATGVSNVEDVIDKFTGQKASAENLLMLREQNHFQVEKLKKDQKVMLKTVEERKLSGHTNKITRKIIDEKEELLITSICKSDRTKNDFDRTSSILMKAKTGAKHLQEKVASIATDLNIDMRTFDGSNPAAAIWSTGNVLVELMARIREEEMKFLHDIDSATGPPPETDQTNNSLEYEIALEETRPYNKRVSLPSAKDDPFEQNDSGTEVFNEALHDEEELSRDRVKKASCQIIRAQRKKRSQKDEID